jgi:molybdenum cofactor cytidylyltransferase
VTPALVLAAGASQRFGYGNKLLAPLAGQACIVGTLQSLRDAGIRRIHLVCRSRHDRVARTARRWSAGRRSLRIVATRTREGSMSESLRVGVASLPDRCSAALICMGDMPALPPALVRRVLRAARPPLDYVRPVCGGRPGHPVHVSERLFGALTRLEGDIGARNVLAGVAVSRRRLLAAGPNCLNDIDTPAALRRARRGPPPDPRSARRAA